MKKLLPIAFIFMLSCNSSDEVQPLFQLMKNTGILFTNNVVDGEIENSFYFRNFYNGGGVAIGDINNDGLADVFLTSNQGENKLYLNKGDLKFEDISKKAGLRQDSMWSTGTMLVDINADGWLDIYECNSGHMKSGLRRNKLYINNKDLSFTESAAKYGLDISAYTTQVSFFDYDLDGDLDCFMINNSPIPINTLGYTNRRDLPDGKWEVADFFKGGGDHLFRNDDNFFKEVTKEAGIHGSLISFGLGVSVGDINLDGYPDVYIANDSYERDYLYINQKNGTFKDEFEVCMEQNSFSSMGADICDINNDGYPDIFTTDMLPDEDYRLKTLGAFDNIDLYNVRIKTGFYRQFMKNCLYVNNRNGQFFETANYSGVDATDWSWGALFLDADNDGLNDIYVCNGVNRDVTNLDFMDFFANDIIQRMVVSGEKESVDTVLKHIPVNAVPNKVYRNNGNLQFSDIGASWGLDQAGFSNGAAYGDLDNDGDLDLVVNNTNQQAFVYKNNARQQNENSYLGVVLKGKGSNSYAIGSKIKVFEDGKVYYREVVPSRGFQSSVDYKQVIGLGQIKQVDSLIVIWPDRTYSTFEKPVLNKVHVLQQPDDTGSFAAPMASLNKITLFQEKIGTSIFEKHTEDEHIDFYYERNLPSMLSREGPGVAKGDVNSDGLEDIYIGGGKGQAGQLYMQTGKGEFIKKEQQVFKMYADFEDVSALFFDANKDGNIDLFLGAGGNAVQPGSGRELQHRIYLNDGNGEFRIDTKAFPRNDMNISVAVNYDYDGDGDEDLFVGSRSVPYYYGETPLSYLYNNDGKGHFTDVTQKLNPNLAKAGMITGAVWADVAGDSEKELIITGEWMATRIFSYNKTKNKMEELTNTNLTTMNGWWQTIESADVNADGKMDLVIGNIGENFYLRPKAGEPVKLWLNDFDGNGSKEQFLTRTINGKDLPVFLKREITDQFPGLKKENLKHSDYAKKTIQQLFSKEVLAKSEIKQFNYCSSILALNEGNGKFKIELLPQMVQLSNVNAIGVVDINGDSKPDIIAGGNKFVFPPQFGRLDASYGQVLLNEGAGKYKWIEPAVSGINERGEIKAIKTIRTKNNRNILLIVQNDQEPALYQIK